MKSRELRQSIEDGSLCFLHCLLGALHRAKIEHTEADSDNTCVIYNFEKEFCINRIIIMVMSSDDPKGLMDKVIQFLNCKTGDVKVK